MTTVLDNNMGAIKTPAQACDHYLPIFVKGDLDLMAIKKELRQQHKFSEEDVTLTARILSNAHFKHTSKKSGTTNANFNLVVGIVIAVAAVGFAFYLKNRGFIALLPLSVLVYGAILIFQSLGTIKRNS